MPTITAHVSTAQAQWLKEHKVNKSHLMQLAIESLMQKAGRCPTANTAKQ